MLNFCGEVEYKCDNCEDAEKVKVKVNDFEINQTGSARNMGQEIIHDIVYETYCENCKKDIILSFSGSEYPVGIFNSFINNSVGATTTDEPDIM